MRFWNILRERYKLELVLLLLSLICLWHLSTQNRIPQGFNLCDIEGLSVPSVLLAILAPFPCSDDNIGERQRRLLPNGHLQDLSLVTLLPMSEKQSMACGFSHSWGGAPQSHAWNGFFYPRWSVPSSTEGCPASQALRKCMGVYWYVANLRFTF